MCYKEKSTHMANSVEFLEMDLFLLMMANSDIKKYSSAMLLLLKELSVRSQISFLCFVKSS
jgi:hypothetical protein